MERSCELCGKKATTNCEVCGSFVCSEHKREYGCDICKGGVAEVE
jgi:hypothetical protein